MNWFKHDTNATQDAKLKKLLIRHGVTGYAVYFHCIELIASDINENNLTFELEHDAEIIADDLRINVTNDKSGIEVVEEVMRTIIDLGLFDESDNRIFCFKLLKRLDSSMTSNKGFRDLITSAKENHDKVMTSHDGIMQDKIRRDKKDKKILEEIYGESDDSQTPKDNLPEPLPPKKRTVFKPPTTEEVKEYCEERKNGIDPDHFINFYSSKGWMIGKNKMKDWKASVRTWEKNQDKNNNGKKDYSKLTPLKMRDVSELED